MAVLQRWSGNGRYFAWRGKPCVLMGSGEHYGAVLNLDFDYRAYLRAVGRSGLNVTRTFAGGYREVPGSFNIVHNTLAPLEGRYACPWQATTGADGRRVWDLSRWDEGYFARLADFVREADANGVVVEIVLFCYWYSDGLWEISPWNAANNVQGIGQVRREAVYGMGDERLQASMEEMVRRVVRALNGFDNVYFEVMNEPYSNNDGTAMEAFQRRIAAVIAETERGLAKRHLIAVNVANGSGRAQAFAGGLPAETGVLNFHYARPAAVAWNDHLELPMVDDETGFAGQSAEPYRYEAWDFMVGGGAGVSHLDYSFTCDHPDGTAAIVGGTPGFGGVAWRAQLRVLKEFLERVEVWRMRPMPEVASPMAMRRVDVSVLGEGGRAYVAYAHGGTGVLAPDRVGLLLPAGQWEAEWIAPATGNVMKTERFAYGGGWGWWGGVPQGCADVAVVVKRV